jgi:hypothetical protein
VACAGLGSGWTAGGPPELVPNKLGHVGIPEYPPPSATDAPDELDEPDELLAAPPDPDDPLEIPPVAPEDEPPDDETPDEEPVEPDEVPEPPPPPVDDAPDEVLIEDASLALPAPAAPPELHPEREKPATSKRAEQRCDCLMSTPCRENG